MSTLQYCRVLHCTVQFPKKHKWFKWLWVHYSTVQYCTVQYRTVQYSFLKYINGLKDCEGIFKFKETSFISQMFKGYLCESEMLLFNWKVSLNSAYSPFKGLLSNLERMPPIQKENTLDYLQHMKKNNLWYHLPINSRL